MRKILLLFLTFVLISQASAVFISDINAQDISPGKEGKISITVENDLQDTIEDVSVRIDLTNLPFRPIGSSEDSANEIDEDEEEDFSFRLKSANDISPGDYQIPFVLSYFINNTQKEQKGSFGLSVTGNVDLDYTISAETPVIGERSQITLRIVNKGLADAGFVNVKLQPSGYSLLSDSQVYIGEVASDDFETATFEVLFKDNNPVFEAIIEYRNFENDKQKETVILPITVYSREEALKLGIIKRSNVMLIVSIIILIILLWILWRFLRKRQRLKKSLERR